MRRLTMSQYRPVPIACKENAPPLPESGEHGRIPGGGSRMRTYYDIRLGDRTVTTHELEGEAVVKVGRYHIAKTLLDMGVATVDPLSPANPLIFSAGPFGRAAFSHANPTSGGGKRPPPGSVDDEDGRR